MIMLKVNICSEDYRRLTLPGSAVASHAVHVAQPGGGMIVATDEVLWLRGTASV